MIHVIMGLKGSGKTKKLIDSIHEAVEHASGDVVCIEYGKKLTYDVNYRVRLVDSEEYGIRNLDMLKGFLPVWLFLHSGEDITPVTLALVLLAPVLGHAFSCFYGLRGGKGIAVSFGSLLGLVPLWSPVLLFAGAFVFFSVVVKITPHFQRTAITYFVTLLLEAFTHQPDGVVLGFALISGVVFLRLHMSREPREHTQVLLAGKEIL